jgi:plasmid stability protein
MSDSVATTTFVIRNVPMPVQQAIKIRAATADLSVEAYLRRMLQILASDLCETEEALLVEQLRQQK